MYPESSDDSGRQGEGVKKVLSPYKKKESLLLAEKILFMGKLPLKLGVPQG